MDPILQLVERSSGIMDPTLGSMDTSGRQMNRQTQKAAGLCVMALGQCGGMIQFDSERGTSTTNEEPS